MLFRYISKMLFRYISKKASVLVYYIYSIVNIRALPVNSPIQRQTGRTGSRSLWDRGRAVRHEEQLAAIKQSRLTERSYQATKVQNIMKYYRLIPPRTFDNIIRS